MAEDLPARRRDGRAAARRFAQGRGAGGMKATWRRTATFATAVRVAGTAPDATMQPGNDPCHGLSQPAAPVNGQKGGKLRHSRGAEMKPYVICHMNSSVDGAHSRAAGGGRAENRMAGLFERLHEAARRRLVADRPGDRQRIRQGRSPTPITPTRPIRGNPGSRGATRQPTASRSMRRARSPGDGPTSAATRSSRC